MRSSNRVQMPVVAGCVAVLLTAAACQAGGAADAGSAASVTASGSAGTSPSTASETPGSTMTSGDSPTATGTATASATGSQTDPASPAARELPRGGTELFPRYRLVGYSGAPGSAAFGRLGIGDLDDRVKEMERRARPLAGGREVLPVLELITVVANSTPGGDGDYNTHIGNPTIKKYLAAARRHKALLLLDIQPGRADFLTVVKGLERWLKEPDVGLALDPEWAVEPGQVPGQTYGRTTGRELDSVAAYLDALVRREKLPQKAMIFHQVAAKVVRNQEAIRERPGVVVVKSVDGIGSYGAKLDTWRVLVRKLPPSIHTGFKLFYVEDRRHGPLMTPAQVLKLRPRPEYVLYE